MAYKVILTEGASAPVYLSREQSGNYSHYWSEDESQAVTFSNKNVIPEVGIDISDAEWVDNDGNLHGPIF